MSNEKFEGVIDALYQCALKCIQCENACLEEDNVQGMVECIKLNRECAETCLFAAKMLAANSELTGDYLNLCTKICDMCGDECQKHASQMDHCKFCAESCKMCSEECKAIVRVNVV